MVKIKKLFSKLNFKKPVQVKRVRTPTVLQMEAVECGAASLAIILSTYGRFVPLEELRVACGVSRDGSKASNVIKAARSYGLQAKGFRKEPEALLDLPLPMIVHWNFNHFLVVEGFADDIVYLNDPAFGPRKVSKEEFDQSFTGVVLAFELGPDFEKGGEQRSVVKSLKQRLPGSRIALIYVVLAGLFLVVPGLIIPTFTRVFVDEILVGGLSHWIGPLLLGMGLITLLNGALTWLQEFYLLRFETKLALSSSAKFFWHVFHLPIEFFTQRHAGDIGSRVAINDSLASLLSGQLASTVISLVTVVFYVILMFQYDMLLTIIGIVIVTLNLVSLRYSARRRVDGNQRLIQEQGKLAGTAMSGLQNIETLKATGTESDFYARWAGYYAKLTNAQQALARDDIYFNTVPTLLTALNTAAILSIGGLKVMDGQMTVGMLVAFQGLMDSFIGPFTALIDLGGVLQATEGSLNRLDDVLHYPADEKLSSTAEPPPEAVTRKLAGYVELVDFSFGYNPMAPPLIKDFSLSLKPGSRVALVGGSGSGKSTVAKVVGGLYTPWSGQLLFDNEPREELPRVIVNNSLAMVDQDIFLFEGTVRDNLTLWDVTVPEAVVIQAAKDACIHEIIAARPGGYDSMVAEGGLNFSGGQRQRLEIARALVNNPTILVLDEATSALDPTTEQLIDKNLRRRGCTCLIVAHRLSTIRDCDEIIVLDRGRIVQRGSHVEMSQTQGSPYAMLVADGEGEGH